MEGKKKRDKKFNKFSPSLILQPHPSQHIHPRQGSPWLLDTRGQGTHTARDLRSRKPT